MCPFVPASPLPAPLLTCSPARHPAATPWWTAPLAPTGLRSLVGPSAGDNHTTAAGGVGLPGPALCRVTPTPTPRNRSLAPGGRKRRGGGGGRQAALRALGPEVGGPNRKGLQVASYHLYPDIGGEGLLSLILGVQNRGLNPHHLPSPDVGCYRTPASWAALMGVFQLPGHPPVEYFPLLAARASP